MRAVFTALAASALLLACGDDMPPPAKVPKAPPPPVVPDCPSAIAPGGDPGDADVLEGKPIARRCILGGTEASRKRVESEKLLGEGDVLGPTRLRADLGTLMKLGILDDASAYGIATPDGKGVVLVYTVRDRPLVADIAFEGAKVLGNDALTAKVPIAKGATYDPQRISAIAQAAREEYLLRGYGGCRVIVTRDPAPFVAGEPEQVHVRIKVDEGQQWHLTKVELKGNRRVGDADIRKALNLTVGAPFVQEEVERARESVTALYYDRGFVAMHLDLQAPPPDDKGNAPVAFVVDEGDPYTVRALHVTGVGGPFEKELLDKVMKSKPRQVMNRTLLMTDIAKMKEFFQGKNKEVQIQPQTEVDPKAHTIDITLDVTE